MKDNRRPVLPHGVPFARMYVTPEIADAWLRERNVKNFRDPDERLIEAYAGRMAEPGVWQFNGDAIRFDENGDLSDGQNRLHACVRSGVPFETMVIVGLAVEATATMDGGKKRTVASIFSSWGEKNCAALGGASLWLVTWRRGYLKAEGGTRPRLLRLPEARELMAAVNAEPGFRDSVVWAASGGAARKTLGPSLCAFLHYACGLKGRGERDDFFEPFKTGAGLTANSAVWALRRRLLEPGPKKSGKMQIMETAALAIKSWDYHVRGRPMYQCAWRTDGDKPEAFPTLEQYPPRRG